MTLRACLLCLLAILANSAELTVERAWSRATVVGQQAGGVFCVIRNAGTAADRLLSATCPLAPTVEIHEIVDDHGVMRMRAITGGLEVAAGATAELKPGSNHIMLIGLSAPLARGSTVPLTLRFAVAGEVTVRAEVLDPWSTTFDDR
jgi:copper(I)-binding protein